MDPYSFKLLYEFRLEYIEHSILEDSLAYAEWDEANPHRKEDELFDKKVFFETEDYRKILGGFRGRNYKKPFKNKYKKYPTAENKASLFFDYFAKRRDVIGYLQPYKYYYPYALSPESMEKVRNPKYLPVWVQRLHWEDNHWVETNKDSVFDQAMALTKRLFKSDKKIGKVEGFTFLQKLKICKGLNLNSSPGLPFCNDPYMEFKGDCLDRLFSLAEEINASAMVMDPKDVEVPPCTIFCRECKPTGLSNDFYPSAVSIIEKRFVACIESVVNDPNRRLPMCFQGGFKVTKMVLESLTKGRNHGCVITFPMVIPTGALPELIDSAFSVIKQWLDMKSVDHSAEENERVFEFLKYYFKSAHLLLPTGQLIENVCVGISGSDFTPFVWTFLYTFAVVYSMLKQGVESDNIEGNVYSSLNEVAFSVPATFSADKLLKDLHYLGFAVEKRDIKLSSKSSDLSFNGYTLNGCEFDISEIMRFLSEL